MNERIAVKYHERLVEALDTLRDTYCEGDAPVDGEGCCMQCARRSCGKARTLLAEIEEEKK